MPDQLITTKDEKFTIESHGVMIMCQRLPLQGHVAYHVYFSSKRKPIVVAKANFVDSDAKWTSVPEGRQKEAEGIGALIEQYLSMKD